MAIRAFFSKGAETTCRNCGTRLRLTGYWWVVLFAPFLAMLAFPFDWPVSTALSILLLCLAIAVISLAIFLLLVRIEEVPVESKE
jgi:hypothetical protein